MPYDPNNPDQFRVILKKFGLTSTYILKIANALGFPDNGTLIRQDLTRFMDGGRTEKHSALALLWNTLEKHEIYSKAFPGDPAAMLAPALPSYFMETPNAKVLYRPDSIRKKLAGRYTMYRAETHNGLKTGWVMRSLLEVVDTTSGPCIFETQRSPESTIRAYEQDDAGFLFSLGEHVFFLMKQQKGGVCVKFFVAKKFDPSEDDQPIDTFDGVFSVASNQGMYGLRKFFCKRLALGEHIDYTSLAIKQISIPACRIYLHEDIENEMDPAPAE